MKAAIKASPQISGTTTFVAGEASGAADLGETVGEQRQTGGHQRQAADVELAGGLALTVREDPQRRDRRRRSRPEG